METLFLVGIPCVRRIGTKRTPASLRLGLQLRSISTWGISEGLQYMTVSTVTTPCSDRAVPASFGPTITSPLAFLSHLLFTSYAPGFLPRPYLNRAPNLVPQTLYMCYYSPKIVSLVWIEGRDVVREPWSQVILELDGLPPIRIL